MNNLTHGHDPETLYAWDARHSWHPFTPMTQYLESDPIMITCGDGVRLKDAEGKWYLDGSSSVWLNVHGHREPNIDEAIRLQLGKIAHSTTLGQANVPATVLARRLIDIVPPGLTRTQFSDSGATAVEIALKIAIQYWANLGRSEKKKVLGFRNNYHGDTLGAMAVAPDPLFHRPYLWMLPENMRVEFPSSPSCPLVMPNMKCAPDEVEHVDRMMAENGHQLAAVIVEPVLGAGGIYPAPPGFLRALRECCDRHEVLLIVDEVATGFGRTGWPFACGAEAVTPDMLCIGKGLTGGYLPVAATMTTEHLYEAFLGPISDRRAFYHGHSYAGNQLGCAAALANIDLCDSIWPVLSDKVQRFAALSSIFEDAPFVGVVRQRGMMLGIELMADTKRGVGFDWAQRAGYPVADAARKRGLLVRPIGSTVILMPPLASTVAELGEMVGILRAAFDDAAPILERLTASMIGNTQ